MAARPERPPAGRARTALSAVLVLLAAASAAGLALVVTSGEPGPPAGDLSWAPPELDDPETLRASAEQRDLHLEDGRDYVVELPDEPLEVEGGLSIVGGDDVVLVGGHVVVPAGASSEGHGVRGLYLKDQTGTVHVEGLAIDGPGLGEGVNLDQRRGAVVQLQNLRIGTTRGERDGHHADVLQTWGGPRVLRIDRLTASTGYQGFFLLPNQHHDGPPPEEFDLRRIDVTGTGDSAYLGWRDEGDWPLRLHDVWLAPADPAAPRERWLRPASATGTAGWSGVRTGTPPDGSWVPEGVAGVGYRTPGYRS